jgi:hypothetical protein
MRNGLGTEKARRCLCASRLTNNTHQPGAQHILAQYPVSCKALEERKKENQNNDNQTMRPASEGRGEARRGVGSQDDSPPGAFGPHNERSPINAVNVFLTGRSSVDPCFHKQTMSVN